jgi:hypothetical protein
MILITKHFKHRRKECQEKVKQQPLKSAAQNVKVMLQSLEKKLLHLKPNWQRDQQAPVAQTPGSTS